MTTTNETTQSHLSTADFAAAADQSDERRTEMTADRADATQTDMPAERQPVQPRVEDRAAQPALFKGDEGETFHRRWSDIQASFVDEPQGAVKQADTLVAEVMQRLAQGFAEERQTLEQQWARGGNADTEELRLALRRYRSFFDRLLAM